MAPRGNASRRTESNSEQKYRKLDVVNSTHRGLHLCCKYVPRFKQTPVQMTWGCSCCACCCCCCCCCCWRGWCCCDGGSCVRCCWCCLCSLCDTTSILAEAAAAERVSNDERSCCSRSFTALNSHFTCSFRSFARTNLA